MHGPMILDIARLLLFPALMAFAAASDLLTMTISNRISVALIGGFLALALLSGMGFYDILSHLGAGAAVLGVAFACFAFGWIGGDRKSTRLNSSHANISYAVFCLKKKISTDIE